MARNDRGYTAASGILTRTTSWNVAAESGNGTKGRRSTSKGDFANPLPTRLPEVRGKPVPSRTRRCRRVASATNYDDDQHLQSRPWVHVDWITDTIAIGNYLDALDADLLRREKIASALSLDAVLYGKEPSEYGLKRIEVVPLEDALGNEPRLYRLAVDYLRELVQVRATRARPVPCRQESISSGRGGLFGHGARN